MGARHTDYIVAIPYTYLGVGLIALTIVAIVLWLKSQGD